MKLLQCGIAKQLQCGLMKLLHADPRRLAHVSENPEITECCETPQLPNPSRIWNREVGGIAKQLKQLQGGIAKQLQCRFTQVGRVNAERGCSEDPDDPRRGRLAPPMPPYREFDRPYRSPAAALSRQASAVRT